MKPSPDTATDAEPLPGHGIVGGAPVTVWVFGSSGEALTAGIGRR
jgi:hypothetical protein